MQILELKKRESLEKGSEVSESELDRKYTKMTFDKLMETLGEVIRRRE